MKSARQKAVKYTDDWMSRYIRRRDGRCVQCGKTEGLTNGHLITRKKYATRWLEKNCYCQCRGCNMMHAHQPEIFTDWWISKHGEEEYHEMVRLSNQNTKLTTAEIRELGDYYKAKYKELDD